MEINENALFATLKDLGQNDASKMRGLLLLKNAKLLQKSGLKSIILDTDSTVMSVCGNQEGAKCYHPLIVIVSEMKLLYHIWFRTGAAYTSNGIVDFLQEVKSSLIKAEMKI